MFLLSVHAVSVTCLAWFSEDRPFAVGYSDGKLLLGTKEPTEKGGAVLIDAHKDMVVSMKWDPTGKILLTTAVQLRLLRRMVGARNKCQGWIQEGSGSEVCVSAERTHHSCPHRCFQSWWADIGVWGPWWPHEYLVFTGKIIFGVVWFSLLVRVSEMIMASGQLPRHHVLNTLAKVWCKITLQHRK